MTMKNIAKKLLLVLVAGILVSCGGMSDQASLQKAREYLGKHNYRAALITVKSLLGQHPDSADARLLLSEIYLRIGDGTSAEKELHQYIINGGDEKSVRVKRGQALLLQHAYARLVKEIGPEGINDKEKSVIYAMQGDAFLYQNQMDKSLEAYKKALALDSLNQRAMLGMALYYHGIKNRLKADAELNRTLAAHPDFAKAYYIKGQIEDLKGAEESALEAYKKAVQLYGSHIYGDDAFIARLAFVNLSLRMGKIAQAKLDLHELVRVQPGHPLTLYTQAILFYLEKNFDQAEQKLYQVLKVAPDNMASHLLLGAILYNKGSFEQANNYVTRYVANIPSNIQARKLLAAIRIKLQRQDEAIEVLKQAGPTQRDSEIVAMIGQLAIEAGKPQLAMSTLKAEAVKHPGDLKIREILARSLMEQGEYHEAINTIKEYSGPDKENASLLLIEALLKKGDQKEAKTLVDSLVKKYPDNSAILTAAGYVALDIGGRNEARNYFESAIGKQADFIPAILYLARMDVEDGRLDGAQRYYDRILLLKQTNSQALMGLAQIEERRGNTDLALKWLNKAHEVNKEALIPALILANYHLGRGEPEKALSLLGEVVKKYPGSVKASLLQARAYAAAGNIDAAEKAYLGIIKKHPAVTGAYVDLGALYTKNNEIRKAKNILAKAVITDPNSLQARGMMGIAEMQGGNYDLAIKIARQIQKDNNASAVGFVLAGDIYLQQKKYQDAVNSYTEAGKRTNSSKIAYKLFHVYQVQGKTKDAVQVLEGWVKKHPLNLEVEFDLANAYLWTSNTSKAESTYKNILDKNPNHIGSLNNLAELYMDTSPKSALDYAKKAYELSPQNVAIQDTLGWVYYKNGNLDQALDLVSRAVTNSEIPTIHYHYAVLLAKAGQSEKSIHVLKKLLDNDKKFAEMKDARVLLESLQK